MSGRIVLRFKESEPWKPDKKQEWKQRLETDCETQKYIEKGCQVYLAQVTSKKTEDKSGERRLEDVPIVREFPEVFLEDLPGLPPTRQVEFPNDLGVPGLPVARAPLSILAPGQKCKSCLLSYKNF
ncbi:hypothetical protein Tco_0573389 [Tanacetum coccineum]